MTIKEIAQLCGVSRGTVDRVLNHRGKVKPETETLILRTIHRMGYTKNIAGKALTVKKNAPVFNLADLFIFAGTVLSLISVIISNKAEN